MKKKKKKNELKLLVSHNMQVFAAHLHVFMLV